MQLTQYCCTTRLNRNALETGRELERTIIVSKPRFLVRLTSRPRMGELGRLVMVAGFATIAGLGGHGAASAEPLAGVEYPVIKGSLGVSDGSKPTTASAPGGSLVLSGGGFAPGATVTISIESIPRMLGAVAADGSGSFVTTVVIPVDMSVGTHTLKASGPAATTGSVVLSKTVDVVRLTPLPAAGSSIRLIVPAVGSVLFGAALVLFARSHRRRAVG